MPGIAHLSIAQFHARVRRFNQRYVAHWNRWLEAAEDDKADLLGSILRGWNACRPNRMRRTAADLLHPSPYIEDLISVTSPHIESLAEFNIARASSFTTEARASLTRLWELLQELPYHGSAKGGLASVVGISKATLLLSNGRVGPAFDGKVRENLGIRQIENPEQWMDALEYVNADIRSFESANGCTFEQAAPAEYRRLRCGRVYDMALGPGG